MERQNQHFYYGNFEYRTFEPLGPTLETKTWIEVAGRYNLDLVKVSRRWLTDTYIRYKSFWTSYIELNVEELKFDDREIGNGIPLERPAKPGVIFQAGSDRRKSVFFEASTLLQKHPAGGNIEARVRALVRAHPQLELDLAPSVSHTPRVTSTTFARSRSRAVRRRPIVSGCPPCRPPPRRRGTRTSGMSRST